MIQYAQRSALHFEPGESASFAMDATGTLYATPSGAQAELKDLARLSYLNASLRWRLSLSAADSTGDATVQVKAGATVVGSVAIAFDGASVYRGDFRVNLADAYGATPLTLEVVGDTAAGAGVTGTVAAVLDVEHPLVVGVA